MILSSQENCCFRCSLTEPLPSTDIKLNLNLFQEDWEEMWKSFRAKIKKLNEMSLHFWFHLGSEVKSNGPSLPQILRGHNQEKFLGYERRHGQFISDLDPNSLISHSIDS